MWQFFKAGRIKRKNLIFAGFLILVALVPIFFTSSYIRHIMAMIFIYGILAMSLNLITGITGQLSLGHAAFYGLGAYTSALFTMQLHWPFAAALLAAICVAGLFGFILGVPCLRLSGDYLCIVTIGFAEIIRLVFQNWVGLTRGPMGIPGIPPISLFHFTLKTDLQYLYFFLIVMVLVYIVMERIQNSQIGRALIAIREDEVASGAMGINLTFYKVLAFVVSALFAGMAGSFMAHYMAFIGPMNFTVDESLLVLQMIILGGLGSNVGAIIGAFILVIAPEALRVISNYRMLFNGALMIGLMIWRPQGLFGTTEVSSGILRKYLPWLFDRKTAASQAENTTGGDVS